MTHATVPVRDGSIICEHFNQKVRPKYPPVNTYDFYIEACAAVHALPKGKVINNLDGMIVDFDPKMVKFKDGVNISYIDASAILSTYGRLFPRTEISPMPGCCGINVWNGFNTHMDKRVEPYVLLYEEFKLKHFLFRQIGENGNCSPGSGNLALASLNKAQMTSVWYDWLVNKFGFARLTQDFFNMNYLSQDSHIALFGALHSDKPVQGGDIPAPEPILY